MEQGWNTYLQKIGEALHTAPEDSVEQRHLERAWNAACKRLGAKPIKTLVAIYENMEDDR